MSLYVAVRVGLSVHIRVPARFHIVPVHRAITNLKTTPQLVAETMHRSSAGRQCRGSRVGVKICSGERRKGDLKRAEIPIYFLSYHQASNLGSTYCIVQGLRYTLFGQQPQRTYHSVSKAYTYSTSSISSKIITLTLPERRLCFTRTLSMCESVL